MVIKFRCDKCDKKVGVPYDYAGKRVKCPRCVSALRVPEVQQEQVQEQPVQQKPIQEEPHQDEPIQEETMQDVPELEGIWTSEMLEVSTSEEAEETEDEEEDKCKRCNQIIDTDTEFCPSCGYKVASESVSSEDIEVKSPSSFRKDLFRLVSPIHSFGDGVTFFFLLLIALYLAAPLMGFMFMMGKFFLAGYFYAYMFSVIVDTANGDNELPDLPGVTDFWDDIIRPYMLFAFSFLCTCWPLLVIVMLVITQGLDHGFAPENPEEGAAYLNPQLLIFLLILSLIGLISWPMVMLGLALGDGLGAIRPDLVILSIIKTLGPYLICCISIILCGLAWLWSSSSLAAAGGDSIVSLLLSGLAGQIGSLCLFIYTMRVMGLLYRHYKHRLAWEFE